jgi:hypothetical protein
MLRIFLMRQEVGTVVVPCTQGQSEGFIALQR